MHKIFGGEDISINHYSAHRRISIKNYEIIYLQVIYLTVLSPQTTTKFFEVQNFKLIDLQEISRPAYIL
jgi:hypothetical protein